MSFSLKYTCTVLRQTAKTFGLHVTENKTVMMLNLAFYFAETLKTLRGIPFQTWPLSRGYI